MIVFWSLAAAVWTVCRRRDEDLLQRGDDACTVLASHLRFVFSYNRLQSGCESGSLVLITFLIVRYLIDLKPRSSFKSVTQLLFCCLPAVVDNECWNTVGCEGSRTGKEGRIWFCWAAVMNSVFKSTFPARVSLPASFSSNTAGNGWNDQVPSANCPDVSLT